MATTTKTYSTAGSFNWICPPGVTSLIVKLWGGGGAGAGRTTQGTGGGGQGGAFAQSTVTVTPGTTYTIVVAAARAGTTGNAAAGNDSTFAATVVVAKGGASGTNAAAGSGDNAATSTGDTKYKGGDGAPPNGTTSSGAGGGGAGTTGAGGNASTTTAGTGTSLSGGNGANGRTTAGNGAAGSAAGGGGAGAWRAASTNRTGGGGAIGRAELSYTTPKMENLTDNFDDNSVNAALWTQNAFAGTVAETGQVLRITPTNNTVGGGGELLSTEFYDLVASYAFCKSTTLANGSIDTAMGAYINSDNYVDMFTESGTLYARKTVSGSSTNVSSVAYSASTLYWRIREAGGTTYWEYSADTSSWTTLASESNPITLTSVQLVLSVYEWEAVNPAGYAEYDNVNVTPGGAPTTYPVRMMMGMGM